ncbi:SesB-related regulatory protein, putative [Aspergillus fumigatus A1163]|uniref:SesB-related regulatory protein, putative n=1 Tax=Aspergillus fumigatus (strain CBS 144.89 / FGSC A1163 / CEA10) TaxID=451804 RepID=B0Y980_ASPFC|nr:SesB-related regulatory protein, putative [Aspergillus fumigatus A1163]
MGSFFSKNHTECDHDHDQLSEATDEMRPCTGLRVLHDGQSPTVDIIFVHGLTGHLDKTWTVPGSAAPWPQALLPTTIERARILAFGYDARVVDWNMVSQNRIGNHSRNLLQAVADYRENDMTNDRHIIFVAHSLGGLICEDALVVSSRSVEKYLRSVFNCTFGLAFMGTPHHGSDMAQWAETMRKFTSVFKQTNPELLRALERDSEVLARIQDEFHTLLRSRSKDSPLEIFCFYEEKPLTVVGTVVPMDSAILPGYLHASLPYDHRDMTKFASVDDPGFITVTNVLRRWVRAISEVAPRPAGQILNIYQMYRGTDKISGKM